MKTVHMLALMPAVLAPKALAQNESPAGSVKGNKKRYQNPEQGQTRAKKKSGGPVRR